MKDESSSSEDDEDEEEEEQDEEGSSEEEEVISTYILYTHTHTEAYACNSVFKLCRIACSPYFLSQLESRSSLSLPLHWLVFRGVVCVCVCVCGQTFRHIRFHHISTR